MPEAPQSAPQSSSTDAAPAPPAAPQPSPAPAQADQRAADQQPADAVEPESQAESAPAATHQTSPIPVVDALELDVAELGLADRLGLGETDPDDEVGPTS